MGRGLGGSGCGFSKGLTDFSPAPACNFLLRPAALPFFAFIRVPPHFEFELLTVSRPVAADWPAAAGAAPSADLERRQRLRIQQRLHFFQSRAALQLLAASSCLGFFRFHRMISSVRIFASCHPASCLTTPSLHANSAPIPASPASKPHAAGFVPLAIRPTRREAPLRPQQPQPCR